MTGFIDWLYKNGKITEVEEYNRKGGVQRIDFRLTYDGALGIPVTVFVADSSQSAHLAEKKAEGLTHEGYTQVPYVGQHKFAMMVTQEDRLVLAVLPQGLGRSRNLVMNDYKAVKFLLHAWWCARWNYENPYEARKLPEIKGEKGAAHKKAGWVGANFGSEFEQLVADIYSSGTNLELFEEHLAGSRIGKASGFCLDEFEEMMSTMLPDQDWLEVISVKAEVLPASKDGVNYKADVSIQFTLKDTTTITTTISLKCPCNARGANIANGGTAGRKNFLLQDLGLDFDSPEDRKLLDAWSNPDGANWIEETLESINPKAYSKLKTIKRKKARDFLLKQVFGNEDYTGAMAILTDHLDSGHGALFSKSFVSAKLSVLTPEKVASLFVFFPSARQRIKTAHGLVKGDSCLRVRLLTDKFRTAMRGN